MFESISLCHLNIRHLHPGPFLAHKYVINVHQYEAVQGQRQSLWGEEGHGVNKHQLMKPEGKVVSEQDPLDPVVQPEILHHGCVQKTTEPNALPRTGFRQQNRLVGGVIGLEDGPIIPGKRTANHLRQRHRERFIWKLNFTWWTLKPHLTCCARVIWRRGDLGLTVQSFSPRLECRNRGNPFSCALNRLFSLA